MGPCPRCGWYLQAGSPACPRCGYRHAGDHEVAPLVDKPLAGATYDLYRGEPVANPPGLEFTPSQARKLQRITPPPMASLSPPSEHGRFRALKLWGTPRKGSLDPSLSVSFRFEGVNPDIVKAELAKVASPLGFALAEPYRFGSDPDLSIATEKLGHHEGTEVKGWFYAERDLKVDKVETHRRDRRRWIGFFGGVIPGAILVYFAFTSPYPWGLLAGPGGLLFGLALVSALSFANADYWSDVIAVRILADLPSTVKGTAARDIPANYVAQFWVVRALSQDWESKVGSGRSLIAGVDYPGLDAVRGTLQSWLSSERLR